jgi:hypothetical protein
LGAALAGAAAGFVLFNASPAAAFPGDIGKYFLAYTLAALALLAPAGSRPRAVLFVDLSLWLVVADAPWSRPAIREREPGAFVVVIAQRSRRDARECGGLEGHVGARYWALEPVVMDGRIRQRG